MNIYRKQFRPKQVANLLLLELTNCGKQFIFRDLYVCFHILSKYSPTKMISPEIHCKHLVSDEATRLKYLA